VDLIITAHHRARVRDSTAELFLGNSESGQLTGEP
jgi:hypothetical protein